MFSAPLVFSYTLLGGPLIFAVVAGLVFAAVFSAQDREQPYRNKFLHNIGPAIGSSLPVVLIGFVAGYLTGTSRAAVVGSIVPAVLALIGGLNVYMFGVEVRNRALVGYCVFMFSLMLFYGVEVGGFSRTFDLEYRIKALSEQELRVNDYRKTLGLSETIPAWVLSSEPK